MLSAILRWSNVAVPIWVIGTFWAFMLYGLAFIRTPTPFEAIACTIAGSLLVTLVHETGHAVAALACGWRVIVFSVWSVGLHLPTRSLAWQRRSDEQRAYGYVVSAPRTPGAGTTARWMWIVAGGPVACLLFAAFALVSWQTWLRGIDTPRLIASNFGLGLAIQACLSAFLSLLPHGDSDGAKLIEAVRPSPRWLEHRACSWIGTSLHYNVRLRDLPAWMVAAHRAIPHEDGGRHADGIDIGRALDAEQPDIAHARALIDTYRVRHGGSVWLDSCDAYLAAIGEGDPETATVRLWQGEPDPQMQSMQHAARASVCAARGDAPGMDAELAAMRKAVRARSPYRNATFHDIERRIRAAQRPA